MVYMLGWGDAQEAGTQLIDGAAVWQRQLSRFIMEKGWFFLRLARVVLIS